MSPLANHLAAVSISSSQLVSLKGEIPLPTVPNTDTFTFSGSAAKVAKFLGRPPASPGGTDGKGLLGAYGGPRDFPGHPARELVYGTGLVLADAMGIIRDATGQGTYEPANGADYPNGSFGTKLQQAALLLKRTPAQVVGVNTGGWDTHTNQGGSVGYHSNLLGSLAQGLQALCRDLQDQWEDVAIVTMTEFGRTSKENGSKGTDHAYATVVFVAGGAVKGGVYNCDAGTWQAGDLFSQSDRYVKHRTDYRAVFAEIFTKHLGDSPAGIDEVIPGYTAAAAARPSDFTFLDFL
jgi:hypothetical protein